MNIIERSQKARQEIEQRFFGLPYIHTALIGLLLSKANTSTGIVENLTYQELCHLLTVKPAPGRKESGLPPKSTVRSILKTIEAICDHDFKMISEGQQLLLQFTSMPEIYTKYDLLTEENSDQISRGQSVTDEAIHSQSHSNTCDHIHDQILQENKEQCRKTHVGKRFQIREENCEYFCTSNHAKTQSLPELNEIVMSAKMCDEIPEKIMEKNTVLDPITLTVNNNKQITNITVNSLLKSFIRDDFYPSEETIREAQTKGLLKVTDPTEIRKFIEYNQRQQSRWEDFNHVFLKWLERTKMNSNNTLRKNDERYPTKISSYELTMQAVLSANQNARSPTDGDYTSSKALFIHGAHPMVMGSNDSDLWPAICE